MNKGIKTVIYPVKDITQATTLFRKFLEVEPYANQPYYVGFKINDQDIGLIPNSAEAGVTAFYHGFYWTATETDDSTVWFSNFAKGSQALYIQNDGEKTQAFSVRCVKTIDSLK